MRRKDRDLGRERALEIIDECEYGVISCIDAGEIFSLPISLARDGDSIYIHGARVGSKARLFHDGKEVAVVCVSYNRVPQWSEAEFAAMKDNGAKLGNRVFTTEYKSAIAKTRAYLIEDEARRYRALEILSRKYVSAEFMSAFDTAARHGLKATNMYELKIHDISAKAKILPVFKGDESE